MKTPVEKAAAHRRPEAGKVHGRNTPLRRNWRRLRRATGKVCLARLAPPSLRLLSGTWAIEVLAPEHRESIREGGGAILALWHGRMLQSIAALSAEPLSVLVSQSGDGDLAQTLLEAYRHDVIRGSSSRGGARALREMVAALRSGTIVAVTPDGPRGPRHSMNPGLAWMARATGFPVLPAGVVADRAWHLDSWDQYDVPKPRARIALAYGAPLHVPREATDADLRAASAEIREALVGAEREAYAHLGTEPDF